MGSFFSRPPSPITESNLPDQSGKVFIVTGATSGVGLELSSILYAHNAKVYLAARSTAKAERAIQEIKGRAPDSKGEAVYLHLDLDDLTTIHKSANEFLNQEKKLNILWNNAGVMFPPQGSKTKQGYESQLGTNNVAPFLFTKLLTPILIATAKTESPGSTRVVWVSSSASDRFSPKGGIDMDNIWYKKDKSTYHKYGVSKSGTIFHASEFARRYSQHGIVSVSLDPGNLATDLYRNLPSFVRPVVNLVLWPAVYGAYTEMFGGFSDEITPSNNGLFIRPFGRVAPARQDIEVSMRPRAEGGTGIAKQFWEWSEEQVAQYL